jgi:glycosyltransferase EpsJ
MMLPMIKISVIIPIYNVENFLVQCLESVLRQSHKNLEIILVNDASTDKSGDIADKYAHQDERIKIITHPANQGLSAARNSGLKQASGEYVAFIDSDDYLMHADYYEHLLKIAVDTEADIVKGGLYFDDYDKFLIFQKPTVLVGVIDKQKNTILYPSVCICLYRKSFLTQYKLLFDPDTRSQEDLLFSVFAVYYANKIALCPDAVYFYRNNPESILRNTDSLSEQRRTAARNYVKAKVLAFAREHNFEALCIPLFDNRQRVKVKVFKHKFLGVTLIKKKEYSDRSRYYLFGKAPIWTVKNESIME